MRCYDTRLPGAAKATVIIDEDWHPKNCSEFPIFGEHCVKGSEGARLAGALEEMRWHDKTHIIRANSINVASTHKYAETLETVCGRTRPDRIRVGVFGVWTHVKVEYLLLNLRTLAPRFEQIAVCGPLCAAPNPDWHAAGLAKLRMMGFRVFDEIDAYVDWMGLS
jgi:nicotinamidase-related amidase